MRVNSFVALAAAAVLASGVASCDVLAPGAPDQAATPSGSPVNLWKLDITALDATVARAILPASALPSWVTKTSDDPRGVGGPLQPACGAQLSTDARKADRTNATWTGATPLPSIDETAIVFDSPVAARSVTEAAAALTCAKYNNKETGASVLTYPEGAFPLPGAPSGTAAAGYCERTTAYHRCSVFVGTGTLTCRLRGYDTSIDAAQELTRSLFPALLAACRP